MSRYDPPPLKLSVQLASLQAQLPDGLGQIQRGRLTWQFSAQPTPVSRRYRLRLVYVVHTAPEMFVVTPNLQSLTASRRIPHLYDQARGRLCLYLPKAREWNGRQLLADTMVPWALLWLFYFEEWLESDDWKGGGVHVV